MARKRIKSIMHGSAEDTRVYHYSHHAGKNHAPNYKIKRRFRIRASKEKFKKRYMDSKAEHFMKEWNNDKSFRSRLDEHLKWAQ
jgi:hypothetical protein